jgi:hypothetical protein
MEFDDYFWDEDSFSIFFRRGDNDLWPHEGVGQVMVSGVSVVHYKVQIAKECLIHVCPNLFVFGFGFVLVFFFVFWFCFFFFFSNIAASH